MRSVCTPPRAVAATVGLVVLLVGQAGGASLSRISCKGQPSGAKSISPETISTPGDGQTPLAIVRVLSARLRIQDAVANGLEVSKSILTNQEAFGQGLANGYAGGGPLNPTGPWQGALWPFRDFADGYVPTTGGTTLGNDIGRIATLGNGLFVVDNIFGAMSFNPENPATYLRGLPGNGATDFARYFAVDLLSIVDIERDVVVTLEDVEVQVLQRNDLTGQISVVNQRSADVTLSVHVPSPASGLVLMGLVPLAARRRR